MHTPGKIRQTEYQGRLDDCIIFSCEFDPESEEERCDNAARLALGWNLLEAGIVELLLSSCDEFMQVNAKHEYEFESNEPRVYRQMHEAIVKARSILSQLPKE